MELSRSTIIRMSRAPRMRSRLFIWEEFMPVAPATLFSVSPIPPADEILVDAPPAPHAQQVAEAGQVKRRPAPVHAALDDDLGTRPVEDLLVHPEIRATLHGLDAQQREAPVERDTVRALV